MTSVVVRVGADYNCAGADVPEKTRHQTNQVYLPIGVGLAIDRLKVGTRRVR